MQLIRVVFAGILLATSVAAQNGHEGYYYPDITSEEVFDRVLVPGPTAQSDARNDLVTKLTVSQIASPYAPRYTMFTKGERSEKLILIALDDEVFSTLYRARAMMAYITSDLRAGEFFIQQGLQFEGTFFDMLQIFGFEELVISDGVSWAHKITFKRN